MFSGISVAQVVETVHHLHKKMEFMESFVCSVVAVTVVAGHSSMLSIVGIKENIRHVHVPHAEIKTVLKAGKFC
jgi:hypothetical protein